MAYTRIISRTLMKLALQWDSVQPLRLLLQWSAMKYLVQLSKGIVNGSLSLNICALKDFYTASGHLEGKRTPGILVSRTQSSARLEAYQ
jgi:hypothetical protein